MFTFPQATYVPPGFTLVHTVKLHVPFHVKGELVLARSLLECDGNVVKVPDLLFFISKESCQRISSLAELESDVQIRTPTEALAFVRLRTSPLTFHAFRAVPQLETKYVPLVCEVLSPSRFDARFLYGLKRIALETIRISGGDGMLDSAAQDNVAHASARQSGSGFEITRTLVETTGTEGAYWRGGPVKVFEVRERVGRDGSYRQEVLAERTDLEQRRWLFTSYEWDDGEPDQGHGRSSG